MSTTLNILSSIRTLIEIVPLHPKILDSTLLEPILLQRKLDTLYSTIHGLLVGPGGPEICHILYCSSVFLIKIDDNTYQATRLSIDDDILLSKEVLLALDTLKDQPYPIFNQLYIDGLYSHDDYTTAIFSYIYQGSTTLTPTKVFQRWALHHLKLDFQNGITSHEERHQNIVNLIQELPDQLSAVFSTFKDLYESDLPKFAFQVDPILYEYQFTLPSNGQFSSTSSPEKTTVATQTPQTMVYDEICRKMVPEDGPDLKDLEDEDSIPEGRKGFKILGYYRCIKEIEF